MTRPPSAAWLGLAAVNVDARNRQHLAADVLTPRGVARVPKPRTSWKWRHWWRGNDQGPTPRCTAFGTLTMLHCSPITHRPIPLADPNAFYREIQAIDRAEGRAYAEGATTLAAMKAAQARGWIGGYVWAYDVDTILAALRIGPVVVGTNWYSSMDRRDAEGIARITPAARNVGGHLYALNMADTKRGLVRVPQTWGDGDYLLPVEDLARLVEREDGECATVRELLTGGA